MPSLRLWIDGCFDGFHYAHANAFRQALFLINSDSRPIIFAGIHSDDEILRNKGPPLFGQTERYNLIRGCRWVYEVVENVPYITRFIDTRGKNIDYVLHGDDVVLDANGNDCYAAFKKAGKYLEFKRTEGMSSTALIQRLLYPDKWSAEPVENQTLENLVNLFIAAVPYHYFVIRYQELKGSSDLDLVRNNWPPQKKIVYIGGSWDCFGSGHVELLKRARSVIPSEDVLLLVGIWSNEAVNEETGERPLLTLLERALAIIQCKYSDAIILSPPAPFLPESISKSLGIDAIVGYRQIPISETYSTVKYVEVEEPRLQTIRTLREKLAAQRALYEDRQRRKKASFTA